MNQLNLLIHVFLCMFCSSECKGEDKVMQKSGDVIAAEGDTVTLDCTFETSDPNPNLFCNDYFFWYRQHSGQLPEFLMFQTVTQNETKAGLSVSVSADKKQISMKISSAAVSDSAVYYCAVRPTVTGNSKTLYKNLWSKDNRKLHNIH
uniref:Ig-like domain-containing protein n=1 Tax=Amphiprion ocellaris TaxID=80972 RepID=A0AAQ5XP46_AMPOC